MQLDSTGLHRLLLKLYQADGQVGAVPQQPGWPGPLPRFDGAGKLEFLARAQDWWEVFFAIEDYTSARYSPFARHYRSVDQIFLIQLPRCLKLNIQCGLSST